MNPRLLSVVCIPFYYTITSSANAALIDRGNGLIYDSGSNIMWLSAAM